MSKVILEGHILVSNSYLSAVKRELVTHIKLTKQEAGCLVFEVSQDGDNMNRFNVYEEFTDRDSFSAHQVRVRESKWGEITSSVERHYEITDIE